jgi:hypothetical protein
VHVRLFQRFFGMQQLQEDRPQIQSPNDSWPLIFSYTIYSNPPLLIYSLACSCANHAERTLYHAVPS